MPPRKRRRAARPSKPKPKAAPALHERPQALLAWMREDLERALNYVAYAHVQRVDEGHRGEAPMAEVLWALSEASSKEIKERNGPRAWARRRDRILKQRLDGQGRAWETAASNPFPRTQADAGRELVTWIAWWLDRRGLCEGAEINLRTEHCAKLARWISSIVARLANAAGWGKPASRDVDVTDRRITDELRKLRRRVRYSPANLATAVLVGWGLTREKAKDALRNV